MIDERNDDPSTPADSIVETDFDSDEALSAGTRNAVQSLPSGNAQSASSGLGGAPMTIDLELAENTPGTGYAGLPVAGLGMRRMTGGLDNGMFVFAEDQMTGATATMTMCWPRRRTWTTRWTSWR